MKLLFAFMRDKDYKARMIKRDEHGIAHMVGLSGGKAARHVPRLLTLATRAGNEASPRFD